MSKAEAERTRKSVVRADARRVRRYVPVAEAYVHLDAAPYAEHKRRVIRRMLPVGVANAGGHRAAQVHRESSVAGLKQRVAETAAYGRALSVRASVILVVKAVKSAGVEVGVHARYEAVAEVGRELSRRHAVVFRACAEADVPIQPLGESRCVVSFCRVTFVACVLRHDRDPDKQERYDG